MRTLFATSAWSTHYFTMVPLAWAFRSAGHEVTVASAPHMKDLITRTGLPAVATGPDVDLLALHKSTLPHTRDGRPETESDGQIDDSGQIFETWRQATLSGLEDLVSFARWWQPDLIVCDTMAPGGLVAAHVLGVPGVRHLWAVDILGSVQGDTLLGMLPGFYEPFERYGLDVEGDPAVATVDPCPPSLQPPPAPTRMQMQFVPYNGPGELPRDALGGKSERPLACVTAGNSVTAVAGSDAFPTAGVVRGLLEAGADVVLAMSPRDRPNLDDNLSDRVTFLSSPPLHMLLPHCDLIVHQGGAGSTMTAGRYGLPQLTITCLPDQVQIAAPLAAYGAGLHLPRDQADRSTLGTHLDRLLHDQSLHAAAGALRQEILDQPSPQDIAGDLIARECQ